MANLGHNLSQRLAQSQTLALTPAMQLKLKLWQMNLLELSQTIERELGENPLLELLEDGDETPTLEALEEGHDSEVTEAEAGGEVPEGSDSVDLGPLPETPGEMNPEADLEAFTEAGISQVQETEMGAENSWDLDVPRTSSLPDDERTSWEDRLSSTETLQEHLIGQLYQTLDPDDPRAFHLEALIDHVDPKGFLRLDPDQPAETTPKELARELGIDEELLRELLEILQEFDPSGVGCFNVKESLLVQLRHAGAEPDDLAVRIILEQADLLSQRDNVKLRKAMGCTEEDLGEALAILRHLHPTPGRAFDPESERVVKPDVVVLKGEDGNWKVYLNDETVPRLRVSGEYRHFLASAEAKDDKDFIRDKYRSARDFIRGVEDRNRTVLRVSASIVDLQREFLEHGIERLRPMVLRDVAESTGFHESTISRVVKAKTIHTPQGLFDLNYFFSASLGSNSGDDVSATVVKHKIKALVQAEDPAKPLSDETIAKLLERDGIKVARRTVNKYREECKIPPASRRRRR
ncbi:RNA polymerase factor sigma-54 [Geothrix sp. 21YS21S-2]|uniref:RNA polymerase factor sigma-54 n=1 Tax=Geothrix sp. 21YS21S-2 TaxID=3068893 RepID=UPI0027B97FA8|nr:RNA polymerase factor sigma-54 [Geothrix sp. 21YS21S-2]